MIIAEILRFFYCKISSCATEKNKLNPYSVLKQYFNKPFYFPWLFLKLSHCSLCLHPVSALITRQFHSNQLNCCWCFFTWSACWLGKRSNEKSKKNSHSIAGGSLTSLLLLVLIMSFINYCGVWVFVQASLKLVNMQQVIAVNCFPPIWFSDRAAWQQMCCRDIHALINTLASHYIYLWIYNWSSSWQMLQTTIIIWGTKLLLQYRY